MQIMELKHLSRGREYSAVLESLLVGRTGLEADNVKCLAMEMLQTALNVLVKDVKD